MTIWRKDDLKTIWQNLYIIISNLDGIFGYGLQAKGSRCCAVLSSSSLGNTL